MENITTLSGGQYGGYKVLGTLATLTEIAQDETGRDIEEVVDRVACTVAGNLITIDGWQYDTERSAGNATAEFIGMVQ